VSTGNRALVALICCLAVAATTGSAQAFEFPIVGSLSTPADEFGIVSGDDWAHPPDGDGFVLSWVITENDDSSLHYKYTLTDVEGNPVTPSPSHMILELSKDIGEEDIFNYQGVGMVEFGEFGPDPSNPGFPGGESIMGFKLDFAGGDGVAEFDSVRFPQWSDFYGKGGTDSFAYNRDLGVFMNPDDKQNFEVPAVDPDGNLLFKVLAPDTRVPEPTTLVLLAVGAGAFLRRRP
jgi:hypothetical protein